MKLSSLQALLAAVESGSLRAAARRLQLSQPALSKMIRELERELGAPLLQRSSRGVVATAEGRILYQRARRACQELGTAADEIAQLGGKMVGQLHLGAVPLAVMLLIPELLRTFSPCFPDIRLRISEELYVAQLQKLRTAEVDILIGGIPDALLQGEFCVEPLLPTCMVPTARLGSRWLTAGSLAELQQAPWVYTGADFGVGYARTLFEQHGLASPMRGATVNSTLAMLSLVHSADYVALMPQQIARQPLFAQQLAVIPIREQGLSLQLGAILRPESALQPLMRQLLAHLHRAAHQLSQPAGSVTKSESRLTKRQ